MKKLLTMLLLCTAFAAFAQTEADDLPGSSPYLRLSADDAVKLAITNNLMLQQAGIGLDIARRRHELSWNQFLPSVTVQGTLMRENWATVQPGMSIEIAPGMGINTPSVTLPQWRVNAGVSLSLDLSLAMIEDIRTAELEYHAGILSLEKAKLQMEQGIRKMYNAILLMEANLALFQDTFANAQRQAAIAEANFNAGMAPRLTWLQAQVQVENLRPTMNELSSGLRNLKGSFALMLGLPYDTEIELIAISMDSLHIPDDLSQFLGSAAAMQKPDIIELQSNLLTLHSQRRTLHLQMYSPFLRLGWGVNSTFNPRLDPFTNSWFTRDNWNEGGNLTITLGMSLNGLFSFTREGQRLQNMDANIQIQNLRLSQMIRDTELEIFSKINSLETIRTTIEVQRSAVDLAELSYNLTEEAYRAGLQDIQAVNNALIALHQAELQLLTQHFNFLNDLIDLEYSLGLPFGSLSTGIIPNGSIQ